MLLAAVLTLALVALTVLVVVTGCRWALTKRRL